MFMSSLLFISLSSLFHSGDSGGGQIGCQTSSDIYKCFFCYSIWMETAVGLMVQGGSQFSDFFFIHLGIDRLGWKGLNGNAFHRQVNHQVRSVRSRCLEARVAIL